MSEPERAHDLPEPSAALMLILALTHAHVRSLSRKERDRFLLDVSDSLGLQEASLNVLRFRPRSEDRKAHDAMRSARKWWANSLGVLMRLDG